VLVAALLLGVAVAAPPVASVGVVRGLSLLGAVAILAAVGTLAARERALLDRVELAAALLRRILAGEVHHYLPSTRTDAFGALSASVNRLVDDLRTRHLGDEREHVLDDAMVNESPNGLLLTDPQGRVRRYNSALARLLPMIADPIGKAPIDAFPVAELQEVIDETRRTREPSERTATVGRREVLVRGVALADGVGCMGVVLDITSVRAAERARRDFVANVSHELRTPVTALVGYAESLLQDRAEMPSWSQPMLEAMDRNARRLGALIEDVLHLSKIEARQGDLPLHQEPLRPLVREVLARFVDRARQKDIVLRFADGPDVEALVNEEAFEHALGNLVDNALKYTASGGHVDVRLDARDGSAFVSVMDDGIGVDAVHQERIFERFYRVDPGRSRDVGGTGLGLALVKHLCLAMGAEITLVSTPGAGSTFTLRLPK
jgi:two-component system phosphate regulon sensor histidine kinase PhoR